MQKKKSVKFVKICLILFFCILFLAVAGLLLYGLVLKEDFVTEAQYTVNEEEDYITWNDEFYVYNDHLSNYLFIGIDEYEVEIDEEGGAQTPSSDALYLLSQDRVTGETQVVSIPRDTMTDIEVILEDGTSAGYSWNHINLSYSFGDGKHESCRLTKDAVSNLFYGLPIIGYCTMSMGGLAVIPEVIGSFEVVVPNDSLADMREGYEEGAVVTITPENSEFFVRTRDIEVAHSAVARQERQVVYLEAVYQKISETAEKNPEIMVKLYDALQPYLITNIENSVFVELAENVNSGKEVKTWTIPGETVEGEKYDEYHIDDGALYEMMINSFYKRVDK